MLWKHSTGPAMNYGTGARRASLVLTLQRKLPSGCRVVQMYWPGKHKHFRSRIKSTLVEMEVEVAYLFQQMLKGRTERLSIVATFQGKTCWQKTHRVKETARYQRKVRNPSSSSLRTLLTRSQKEIDEAFRRAFLYGVYQYKEQNKNDAKHGLVFPLSQSQFVSALVQPFLPVFTKQQQQSFVMKKTSWKNARKFIMALHKNKLLLAKEFKNEAMVLDVDFDDASFRDFQPYALPEKEASDERKAAKGNAADGDGADDSVGQQLKIVNLYRPKDSLLPLFENSESGYVNYCIFLDIKSPC